MQCEAWSISWDIHLRGSGYSCHLASVNIKCSLQVVAFLVEEQLESPKHEKKTSGMILGRKQFCSSLLKCKQLSFRLFVSSIKAKSCHLHQPFVGFVVSLAFHCKLISWLFAPLCQFLPTFLLLLLVFIFLLSWEVCCFFFFCFFSAGHEQNQPIKQPGNRISFSLQQPKC